MKFELKRVWVTIQEGESDLFDHNLSWYSEWASIISLLVAILSLALVKSIRKNIIKFRRKQRVSTLIEDVFRIPVDALPLSSASKSKMDALKRNVPIGLFARCTQRGRAGIEVRRHLDGSDLVSIREAINDWVSYSEDI